MKATKKQITNLIRKLIIEAMINPIAFRGEKGIPVSMIPVDDYEDAKKLSSMSTSEEYSDDVNHLIDSLYGGPPGVVRMSGGYKGLKRKADLAKFYDNISDLIHDFNKILLSHGMTLRKGEGIDFLPEKNPKRKYFEGRRENKKGHILQIGYQVEPYNKNITDQKNAGLLICDLEMFKKIKDKTVKIFDKSDFYDENILASDLESIVEDAEEIFKEATELLDPKLIYLDIKKRKKVFQRVMRFIETNREEIEFDNLNAGEILNKALVNPKLAISQEVLENMSKFKLFSKKYNAHVHFTNVSEDYQPNPLDVVVNYITDTIMKFLLDEVENLMY